MNLLKVRQVSALVFLMLLPFSYINNAKAQVNLPLEVIGPAGYVESINFNLVDTIGIDQIFLKVYRPSFRNASLELGGAAKSIIRINDGDWISIDTDNTYPFDQEAKFGGVISNAFFTVRFMVDVDNLKIGGSTIDFRFNETDGLTNGFRVLDFNLVNYGEFILSESEFTYDDPFTWEPPLTEESDISGGKILWETAVLETAPLDATPLQTRCTDCHAHDGRDLKYFNYSNRSIIERSVFHGLSTMDGEKIASYIRSFPIATEENARPWNPPYQPGPGR